MNTSQKSQIFSAKQASKKVKKATSTITRAIKSGKLSATKNENGDWEIQASELFRAYPANTNANVSIESNANPQMQSANRQKKDIEYIGLEAENKILHERINLKNKEIELLSSKTEDLQEQRDLWQKQAQTLLLKNTENPTERKKGFFGRIFG